MSIQLLLHSHIFCWDLHATTSIFGTLKHKYIFICIYTQTHTFDVHFYHWIANDILCKTKATYGAPNFIHTSSDWGLKWIVILVYLKQFRAGTQIHEPARLGGWPNDNIYRLETVEYKNEIDYVTEHLDINRNCETFFCLPFSGNGYRNVQF